MLKQRWPILTASCVFLVAAGFYLWTEHRAHLYGALPYVLFLACPLMHLLMHRHGGGCHTTSPKPPEQQEDSHA